MATMPIGLWAQDNTWELPEEEQQEEVAEAVKVNPDEKYLRGAVPEVDGKVVFTTTIDAPGKSASEIYTILHDYVAKMIKAKNQLNSRLVIEDTDKNMLAATFEEWLVFKKQCLRIRPHTFLFSFGSTV